MSVLSRLNRARSTSLRFQRAISSVTSPRDVVIVSGARTPVGSFGGALASLPATKLGSLVTKEAVARAGIDTSEVQELYFGNVVSAGLRQAPARQVALGAGLSESTPCTLINKVCASGMKSVMLASQNIALGQQDVMVAGGMESMSNIPFYLNKARFNGYRYGNGELIDGIVHDGLKDVYNGFHMGMCAEHCAKEHSFSRADQDDFATLSYQRSQEAWNEGRFDDEIVPVRVSQRRGSDVIVDRDEEPFKVNFEKLKKLRPSFKKDGTVTAANASSLNDGAAALVLMSAERAAALGVTPLAKIRSFGDAAHEPINFTTAPSKAIPLALSRAGMGVSDVDYFEINEAFSVVQLVNEKLLGLDPERCNVNGGAVSIGHPIGCSGARIIVTLLNVLKQRDATVGAAGICNGGGGASAIVIERL